MEQTIAAILGTINSASCTGVFCICMDFSKCGTWAGPRISVALAPSAKLSLVYTRNLTKCKYVTFTVHELAYCGGADTKKLELL